MINYDKLARIDSTTHYKLKCAAARDKKSIGNVVSIGADLYEAMRVQQGRLWGDIPHYEELLKIMEDSKQKVWFAELVDYLNSISNIIDRCMSKEE